MPKPPAAAITRVRDELESPERGVRQWSVLEVQGDTWYQIETYNEGGEPHSRTTYITTDLDRAIALANNLKRYVQTELRMYSRLPLYSFNGFVLEPVQRILSLPDGERVVCLRSGLSLRDNCAHTEATQRFAKFREIYRCD